MLPARGAPMGGDGLTLVTATMVRTSPLLKGRSCSAVPWKLYLAIHSVPDGQTAWSGRGGRCQSPAGHISHPWPHSTHGDPPPLPRARGAAGPLMQTQTGFTETRSSLGDLGQPRTLRRWFLAGVGTERETRAHSKLQVPPVLGFCRGTGWGTGTSVPTSLLSPGASSERLHPHLFSLPGAYLHP